MVNRELSDIFGHIPIFDVYAACCIPQLSLGNLIFRRANYGICKRKNKRQILGRISGGKR
jgi:hypothetical protein